MNYLLKLVSDGNERPASSSIPLPPKVTQAHEISGGKELVCMTIMEKKEAKGD